MAIDTIVLTSHHEECGRSILCNSLWKILFEEHLMVWSPNGYIPFLKISHVVGDMTNSSINAVNNLFVITYDENNTNIFSSQSSRSFSKNSWLLLLDNALLVTSENGTEGAVRFIIKSLALEENSALHIDSQLYILVYTGIRGALYEVYRPCIGSKLIVRKLLNVNNDKRRTKNQYDFIWDRRDDLSGCVIPVAFIHSPPYFYPSPSSENLPYQDNENDQDTEIDKNSNNGKNVLRINNVPMVGQSAYNFHLLIVGLNFTPDWKRGEDNAYGVFDDETKKWSKHSIMSLVVDHTAEVGSVELTVTERRSQYVSFSAQTGFLRNRLYMQRPPAAFSWLTFLDVFNYAYWGTFFFVMGASIVMVATFMAILSTFRREYLSTWFQRISSSASVVGLGLLDLDADLAVNVDFESPNSMRLLFFSVSMFGLLNKEVYEAGLTSQLTVQKLASPIDSMEDLAANDKYQILVTSGGADLDYFKEATPDGNMAAYDIYQNKIKNNVESLVTSLETAKEKLLNDPFMVYFSSELAINTGVSEYPCHLVASQKDYFKTPSAYPFYPNSRYQKLFSNKVTTLVETGQYDSILKQVIREKPLYTCLIDQGGYNSLGYKTVFTAFLLMLVGALLAIGYCILEHLALRLRFCYKL